jgi:fructose 1,6-bisphosphate aldolase/phosphatase
MSEKVTISLIKADVGGFPGHSTVRPELKAKATETRIGVGDV